MGAYGISYRVISDDGHPVTGELGFRLTAAGTPGSTTEASGSAALPPADSRSFVERHADHFVVGAVLMLAAFGLLALSRRRE
jgi:hypothetical protein